MTDGRDGVRNLCRATGPDRERPKTAHCPRGRGSAPHAPATGRALRQFRACRLAATAALATLAGITAGTSVLDVAPGVSGPACFLAAAYACWVTGVWQDNTKAANARIAQPRASRPPPSPSLSVVVGPHFKQHSANLGRNLMEGRLGIPTAMFEAVSTNI
jgi:hypothetical protein